MFSKTDSRRFTDGSYSLVFPGVFECRLKPLYPIQDKSPFDAVHVEMVLAKDLEIPEFVAQAQPVVCLQFVAVAGSADGVEVLTTVWIPFPQLPDESCRHEMANMAWFEIPVELADYNPTGSLCTTDF